MIESLVGMRTVEKSWLGMPNVFPNECILRFSFFTDWDEWDVNFYRRFRVNYRFRYLEPENNISIARIVNPNPTPTIIEFKAPQKFIDANYSENYIDISGTIYYRRYRDFELLPLTLMVEALTV